MATPSQLVLRSDLNFEAGKREKVLGTWDEMTAGHKVNVKLNAEIASITGEKGNFTLDDQGRRDDHRRDRDPRHRHPGQSEPGPLPGRRGRARSSTSSTIPANISTSISS